MATFYSSELANIAATPVVKASGSGYGARLVRFRATIVLNTTTVTTSDTVVLANVPAGFTFAFGVLTSSVSLGTSTIAIGTAASTGKYRAAATFTAVDTPTMFGVATQVGNQTALAADEQVILTTATANLPTSANTLVIDLYYSRP